MLTSCVPFKPYASSGSGAHIDALRPCVWIRRMHSLCRLRAIFDTSSPVFPRGSLNRALQNSYLHLIGFAPVLEQKPSGEPLRQLYHYHSVLCCNVPLHRDFLSPIFEHEHLEAQMHSLPAQIVWGNSRTGTSYLMITPQAAY